MRAWTQVKVNNSKLERDGQAGVTQEQTAEDAVECDVKFDLDGVIETHKVADLIVLSAG